MEKSLDNIYSPEASKELPVEKTAAFDDWVEAQRNLPEEEQAPRYKELAKDGEPLVDQRANSTIRELRNKMRKTGE